MMNSLQPHHEVGRQATTQSVAFIDQRIASAPYKLLLPRHDGGAPMLVISQRPMAEAITDMLGAAMQRCKPVPSVLP